ncbi:MAG: type II secretion system F family protein [Planctomycetes bacterium]|nr:type II secretion system F family protein [Planctomycetota bacterium]
MSTLLICIAAFVGVAALVGGVALFMRGDTDSQLEGRLDQMTGRAKSATADSMLTHGSLLESLSASQGFFADLLGRFSRISVLFEQADTTLTPSRFFMISGGLALAGTAVVAIAGLHPALLPLVAITGGMMPLGWLMFRRRRRFRKFAAQLPDGLELVARALRAGHSLAAGFHLVGEEMADPMGKEFNRVFEEQNLGVTMEDALNSLTERIPNLDLKFFATAVVLQRQTGGDLAEILDKIGYLIRERFKIWGQVQALTGEGRLSGIVLLALPPALFMAVYRLNPDYVTVLFTDPMGRQMLLVAAVLQVVGALVIRKIVNIRV